MTNGKVAQKLGAAKMMNATKHKVHAVSATRARVALAVTIATNGAAIHLVGSGKAVKATPREKGNVQDATKFSQTNITFGS
jgi:hypothetical protein